MPDRYVLAQGPQSGRGETVAPFPEAVAPAGSGVGDRAMATELDTSVAPVGDFLAWMPSVDVQSALDILEKGGPVVAVLILMSLLATTVVIMKLVQFFWSGVGRSRETEIALEYWIAGRSPEALGAVRRARSPSSIVLAHGLRGMMNGVEERVVREDVDRVGQEQLSRLRSHMRVLESTVQIAPLLGLFGTVIGMISAFQALQDAGADADPAVLAGGIWVALMTTAVGLAVAIPVAFFNYWLEGRIEKERTNIEQALTSLFTRRATSAEVDLDREARMHVVPAAE